MSSTFYGINNYGASALKRQVKFNHKELRYKFSQSGNKLRYASGILQEI